MLFNLISQNHSDKLCDAGQDQISMKRFLILRLAAGDPKAVFEVADGAFHSGSDPVCIVPFFSPTHSAGISTEVFFRVKVYHSSAW